MFLETISYCLLYVYVPWIRQIETIIIIYEFQFDLNIFTSQVALSWLG